MSFRIPQLAPNTPRRQGLRPLRWFARTVLRLSGWTFVGEVPDVPRLVVIAAPHSSAWDAVWGLLFKVAMGLEITFLAKKEAFVGPLGWLLRFFGGVPIDRSRPGGAVADTVDLIQRNERLWFCLAPEGTRKKVTEWKPGFWRIARAANVPILCAYFHYPEKTLGFGLVLWPSENYEQDTAQIRQWYRPWKGKNRDTL